MISSANTILPKIGPGTKVQRRCPVPVLLDDIGPRDVRRHQVGRELNPAKLQSERPGYGADHECFRGAGQTGNQTVAADEQGDQDLLQDFVLPDDDFADLPENAIAYT